MYNPNDLDLVPSHMRDGLRRYIEDGIAGGSFLMALMANDFMGAARAADTRNFDSLPLWATWIHNHAPSGCHGSPEAVDAWIASGGLNGIAEMKKRTAANAEADSPASVEG